MCECCYWRGVRTRIFELAEDLGLSMVLAGSDKRQKVVASASPPARHITPNMISPPRMMRIGGACVRAPGSIEVEPPFQNAPPSAVQLPSRTKAARTIAAVALSSAGLSPEWIPQPSGSLRWTPTDCQGAGRGSAPSRGVTSDMGAPTRFYK